MKTKTYDCVAMKRVSQIALRKEYAQRKDEFASYSDFINATACEHSWSRQFIQRTSNWKKSQ